ncbi:hypothetical protein GLYMA_12G161050v4 [Glycine max]|nr:hypothetical protein GLYMA_12G161050v4 [Glycine max]KAH1143429.1 hypothetical protein GYH30_033921 [Glycine max]
MAGFVCTCWIFFSTYGMKPEGKSPTSYDKLTSSNH